MCIYASRQMRYNITILGKEGPIVGAPNPKGGIRMPASKAQQRATNKYIAKAYDRINLPVPKGRKDAIQAHAEAHSESVNGFINRAISEAMERDGSAPVASEGE